MVTLDTAFLDKTKGTIWIAYSGGLDSHVLLSLCHALRQERSVKLHAVHINHNLSEHSNSWAQHCEKICINFEIDFLQKNIQLNLNKGDSLEELAREKRYAAFAECLNDGDILLTAHQKDDQAETVLLQLLRGAGPKGLAAMPVFKPFGRGFHARPLLEYSRVELQQYAIEHRLKWIEDESNANVKLTRNFIRRDILPQFAARWPTVTNAIARSAVHCAESQALLEEFAIDILKNVNGSNEGTLSVTKLLLLDNAKQRLILRSWIKLRGYPLPDTKKIETIRNEVMMASPDRMPCVGWEGVEVRRYRDNLYLMNGLDKHEANINISWNISQPLILEGIGILSTKQMKGLGLNADISQVSVRFRQGGEVVKLPGRGRHTLKNLFQEWDVPTWERDRLPLLFVDEKCIGAVGYFIDDDYAAKQSEMGFQPHLDRCLIP